MKKSRKVLLSRFHIVYCIFAPRAVASHLKKASFRERPPNRSVPFLRSHSSQLPPSSSWSSHPFSETTLILYIRVHPNASLSHINFFIAFSLCGGISLISADSFSPSCPLLARTLPRNTCDLTLSIFVC